MVNFSELKKNSKNSLEKLREQVAKVTQNSYETNDDDATYWQPTVDKAGNGSAVIRFLPAPGDETAPFIRIWEHGFKGPTGKWYIETSLTTIGKEDPVSEYNSQLWNSTQNDDDPARKQARDQKRKLVYVSNIRVVDDPAHPEFNGKVFRYRYGKKIFDKIQDAQNSQDEDEPAFDPFNMWSGANFKLKIANVEGYRNYDKSKFAAPSKISDDDDELKAIWESEYSLEELVHPSKFKSYDELKKRLNVVLDLNNEVKKPMREEIPYTAPKEIKSKAPAYEVEEVIPAGVDEEDEDLKFFQSINDD